MELAQQREHYKAVRARLYGRVLNAPTVILGPPGGGEVRSVKAGEAAPKANERPPMPTVPAVIEFPPELVERSAKRRQVVRTVAELYGITVEEMMSPSRTLRLVRARQHCFYLFIVEVGYGWSQTARFFGYDHTTILHGVKKFCADFNVPLPEVPGLTGKHKRAEA